MPRDTASRGWSPGDPVLFDSSVLPGPARQPLGAVKHAKQKDDSSTKPALPRQRQSTLSPWAKAAWQPGMRVVIATSNKSKRSTALIEEEEHRSNAHRVLKGKQRLVAEDEKENVHLKNLPLKTHRTAKRQPCEHIPFQTTNLYEDPPPRKAYCLEDGSPSSVKAVISDNSLNDPDSSIEFLGQHKSSPHSRALRHIALAQANLLEVDRHTSGRKLKTTMSIYSTVSSNIASMAQPVPEPYRRRRIPFAKSPSPSERSYSTDSVSRNTSTANRPTSAELDWDDPVLNPSVRSRTPPSMPGSESSDLPELPFKGRSEGTSAVKPTTTTYRGSETVSQQDWEQLHAPTTATSNRREVDPAKLKKLRAVGRQHMREEKEARMLQKQAKQEELKDKYRTFSYDSTTAITPKVWYYRGLASGQIKFMGCDTRSGFSTEHERLLEEVLADLKGPLGWDLEWEPLTWNATFTRKEVGKAALLQLGDRSNIILFQLERGSSVPKCLLEVLEDPSIVKLGVQIKGDARKISRDYRWPSGDPILPKGLMDLSDLARHVHPTDLRHRGFGLISLQNLVATYLEAYLEKGEVRTSKWENQKLDTKQRKYAANDIFASVQLYQRIIGYAEVDGVEIDFESLIYDSLPRHDPIQGHSVAGAFKPRKAKPSRKVTSASGNEASIGDINTKLTPRVQEAWERWWTDNLDRDRVAEEMGVKPATVVGYIIKALITDSDLPYDGERLRELTRDMTIRNDQMKALQELLQSDGECGAGKETGSNVV